MAKVRMFLRLSEKEQIITLLSSLTSAMKEHPEICDADYARNHRTDIIGVACMYGGIWNIRREDFDKISNLKIENIMDIFSEGYTNVKFKKIKS